MSSARFDDTIHAPLRLRICAMLAQADAVEFATLRDHLDVADSVLSKHLKTLVEAGYVRLDKPTGGGGKMRTWAKLTRLGRQALEGHLSALREMVEAARACVPSSAQIVTE